MEPQLQAKCLQFLEKLQASPDAWPFLSPVDWKAMGLNDYPLIVTRPMDLKTVGRKLKARRYPTVKRFLEDVYLIWSNCKTFNTEAAEVYQHATAMQNLCNKLRRGLPRASESNEPQGNLLDAGAPSNDQSTPAPSVAGVSSESIIQECTNPAAQIGKTFQHELPGIETLADMGGDDKRAGAITQLVRDLESLLPEALASCLSFVAASEAGRTVFRWDSPAAPVGSASEKTEHKDYFNGKDAQPAAGATSVVTFYFDVGALFDLSPGVFAALSKLVETTAGSSTGESTNEKESRQDTRVNTMASPNSDTTNNNIGNSDNQTDFY